MKARHPQRRGEAASTAVTALLALIFFLPVLIAVINSFKTNGEILASAIVRTGAKAQNGAKAALEEICRQLGVEETVSVGPAIADDAVGKFDGVDGLSGIVGAKEAASDVGYGAVAHGDCLYVAV